MPLEIGSVAIDPSTGIASGTGLAKVIFDERQAASVEFAQHYGCSVNSPSNAELTWLAIDSTHIAKALVEYLTANARITIPTTAHGLQRTPSSIQPDVDCQGPSVDIALDGALS